ncbi:hypothetical protein GCM10022198_08710 [Klugiella xanthotipulae]
MLNPSFNAENSVSYSNLGVAAASLGFDSFHIVNLIQVQSRNSKELAQKAIDQEPWLVSRPEICQSLNSADEVVFAWGASRLAGQANRHKDEQVEWTIQQTVRAGHTEVLLMNGSPRHPSRWRQYVGPQKMRVTGDTLEDRFRKVLNPHPIEEVCGLGGSRVSEAPAMMRQASINNEDTDLPVNKGGMS